MDRPSPPDEGTPTTSPPGRGKAKPSGGDDGGNGREAAEKPRRRRRPRWRDEGGETRGRGGKAGGSGGKTSAAAGDKPRRSRKKTAKGSAPRTRPEGGAPDAAAREAVERARRTAPKRRPTGRGARQHDDALAAGELIRFMEPDGGLTADATPSIDDETLLRIHDTMQLVRALDERMITLQRQGRAGFYGACTGEEAAVLGSAAALDDGDWIVPALRQNSAMLFRGFPLTAYVAQVLGNSGDVMKARQMPSHHSSPTVNQVSWSSCIANQLLQAVGVARGMRYRRDPWVTVGYVGDGGTSEGDFHVAMNLAGTWKLPLVLICQNNQWAISVPLEKQTRVTRLADKAKAYGLPGVRVDGNDVLAVHHVVSEAVRRARAGEGATFIEAFTYRIGAHSTSDDPSRYRDESVTDRWRMLDPVERLERHLAERGLRGAEEVEAGRRRATETVDRSVREAEALPPVAHETLIQDVFAEVPESLAEQWRLWSPLTGSGD